jgi:ornithine decarboxylase
MPWVYTDVGKFSGLWEAGDLTFPIICSRRSEELVNVVIAGPTCDSDDVLYRATHDVRLPRGVQFGDHLLFLNTGAYSNSYPTVGFNGFPPMGEYYI